MATDDKKTLTPEEPDAALDDDSLDELDRERAVGFPISEGDGEAADGIPYMQPSQYQELTEESITELRNAGVDIDKLIRMSKEINSLSAFSAILQHILETQTNEPADYEYPEIYIDGFKELTDEISKLALQDESYNEFRAAILAAAKLARLKAIYEDRDTFRREEDYEDSIQTLNQFVEHINELIENFKQEVSILPSGSARRITETILTVDKVSRGLTGITADDLNKLIPFDTAKSTDKGKGKDISVGLFIHLDFNRLPPAVNMSSGYLITPFDMAVHDAACSIFQAGNIRTSATQIHYAMGNTKRPNKRQLAKILDSLAKMNVIPITIDNSKEIAANYKYPAFPRVRGSLLPNFIEENILINGRPTDRVHFLMVPPLLDFAQGRKQITAFPIEMLQAPLSKTDENLSIERYLLTVIAMSKNKDKHSVKLRIDTICENCRISAANKRNLPGKLKTFLEQYKMCERISSYKIEKDCILISF